LIIFELILTTFEASIIFVATGAVLKMGSSLKPNDHNQVLLVQISETLCINLKSASDTKKLLSRKLDD
jgi:hypothetical protein